MTRMAQARAIIPGGDSIRSATTPALRAELARALTITAQGLSYLAAVWAELERRGEDLSSLRSGMARSLPLIANGTLAAEAAVAFAGRYTVLAEIAKLPLPEQVRLASGALVPVATSTGVANIPATAFTAAQARGVFSAGRILTPEEQEAPRDRTDSHRGRFLGLAPAEYDSLARFAAERGLTVTAAIRAALLAAGALPQ